MSLELRSGDTRAEHVRVELPAHGEQLAPEHDDLGFELGDLAARLVDLSLERVHRLAT